jgi:hypothetical protein
VVSGRFQSLPNPANQAANVRYELSRPCPVDVSVFDAGGRVVTRLVDAAQAPGLHSARWNSSQAPAGVYYCRIQAGEQIVTQPLVVEH